MAKYQTPTGPEAEYQPGSNGMVLVNKRRITSMRQMDKHEATALASVQLRYLSDGNITSDTKFTARLIRQMHGDWLGGIYEWAGNYRTVELTKDSFPFPPAYLIEKNMSVLETQGLAKLTPLATGAIGEMCMAVAQIHADLLLIHPFREGNGRLARWLADLMFMQAGLAAPHYGFSGPNRGRRSIEYLDAVMKGYTGDYRPLASFFARAVEDAEEGAA